MGDRRPLPVLLGAVATTDVPDAVHTALTGLPVLCVSGAAPVPDPDDLAGVVLCSGEAPWLRQLLDDDVPVLALGEGAVVLARALGAEVRPAARAVIGWGAMEVLDATDPVLGPLARTAPVLHWHGATPTLPPAAEFLARASGTGCAAFRAGEAWGVLAHLGAGASDVARRLTDPERAAEARDALGPGAADVLRDGARAAEMLGRGRPARALAAFAERCHRRRQAHLSARRFGTEERRREIYAEALELLDNHEGELELSEAATLLFVSRRQLQRVFAEAGATTFSAAAAHARARAGRRGVAAA